MHAFIVIEIKRTFHCQFEYICSKNIGMYSINLITSVFKAPFLVECFSMFSAHFVVTIGHVTKGDIAEHAPLNAAVETVFVLRL